MKKKVGLITLVVIVLIVILLFAAYQWFRFPAAFRNLSDESSLTLFIRNNWLCMVSPLTVLISKAEGKARATGTPRECSFQTFYTLVSSHS